MVRMDLGSIHLEKVKIFPNFFKLFPFVLDKITEK